MNLRKTNKYVNFEMLYLPAGYHVQITTGPIISGFLWSEWRLVEHMCDILPPSAQWQTFMIYQRTEMSRD